MECTKYDEWYCTNTGLLYGTDEDYVQLLMINLLINLNVDAEILKYRETYPFELRASHGPLIPISAETTYEIWELYWRQELNTLSWRQIGNKSMPTEIEAWEHAVEMTS